MLSFLTTLVFHSLFRSSWHSSGWRDGSDSFVLMTSLWSRGIGWLVQGDTSSRGQRKLWVSCLLQWLFSGPHFLPEQRASENKMSILAFYFLWAISVLPRQYLVKFWLCLSADSKVLGYFFFREHASMRRVVGIICQARAVGWVFKTKPPAWILGHCLLCIKLLTLCVI